MEFLKDFIKQTETDSLKTKDYPKEFLDLKMKVSFGQGNLSKVPWVALRAPDMPVSNGYNPVYLFYKEQNILILAYGISETHIPETSWTREIHDSKTKISNFIENPFRYGDSFVYKHYEPEIKNGDVIFCRDGKEISDEELLQELKEIVNFFKECLNIELKDEKSSMSSGLFYMEQQLEDFIIENWNETEFGKKYDLIYEEGDLKSQQYMTDIGRIDILAKDKKDGHHVVIELKRNQTSDDTVGQILRYMGWIEEKKQDENVKGIIVAGKFDEKLYYAQKRAKDVEIFTYEVNFSLNEYKR
ncbi:endonuclease NucS [SAR86 cluster bacterium]|jgi:hypothetical protein|nr:endonuclease NucS [SAR86 cluster bacterium]|tara:strand:- start:133 stop:1035 length:903 start_codon:yes stop_codon:yes gene_type:complete